MAFRVDDKGPEPRAYLTTLEKEGTAICLQIGKEAWLLTKAEANRLAAQLVHNAGNAVKLRAVKEGEKGFDANFIFELDNTSDFVKEMANIMNPYGDFS